MNQSEMDEHCHQRKAYYWTEESVKRKAIEAFGAAQADEALSVLNNGVKTHPRLQLAILKLCNGTMLSIERLVQVANEDERDLLLIEYMHQIEHDPQDSLEENLKAQQRDLEDYLQWIEPKNSD